MNNATCANDNAMAGERKMCQNLEKYYALPAKKKDEYLKVYEASYLFENLPKDISKILRNSFVEGLHGETQSGQWNLVVDYFQNNSKIIPALCENPGTYTMLEKMYHFEDISGVIDNYFLRSISGGQALLHRYNTVNQKMIEHIDDILKNQDKCLMLDIGSGPARNCVDVLKIKPEYKKKVDMHCIEIDEDAIIEGEKLLNKYSIDNVLFVKKSMTKLSTMYDSNVDYGILIGILCSLTYEEKVGILQRLKNCFKPGAKLVAATLTEAMAEKDLLCAYILRETTGWSLQYPKLGKLKEAFEEAGWVYEGYFQEEPTRLYEIGIGVA